MFRLRDKGKLTGQRLARLQRGVRCALDAGAQQSGCSRTANTRATRASNAPSVRLHDLCGGNPILATRGSA